MSKVTSVRFSDFVADYLDRHNFSASEYIENSVKRDVETEKKNKKQNKLHGYSNLLFMILFGCMFIAISTLLIILSALFAYIIAAMGIFMMLYGFIGIYLETTKNKGVQNGR